jgi:TolA-binding protein
MRLLKHYFMLALPAVLMVGCVSTAPDEAYVVEEQGRMTWRTIFDRREDTPADQWDYAQAVRNKGRLKKAERLMLYLHRRWPNSLQAPRAARARADILYTRGEYKDAFEAYQYLIDNYPGRMRDYDGALQSQFEIAVDIMNRRRMRWLFGGYRAPEYAVDYFETVIRNGPQWERAPEAQFLIGKCRQEAEEYELAISAYGVLGYRYPDSTFAEEAAWQQIRCLAELRREYPDSPDILDRILTSTTVYLSTYPQSERRDDIIQLRNRLYEIKAGKVFDEAAFYAKVPKEPEAAILYYELMIAEYPKSRLVPRAEERIAELKRLMAMPVQARTPTAPRSRPLPFTGGDGADDAG